MKLFTPTKYILLIALLISLVSRAQQDPGYTQYMYNTMTVNPGYAGSTGSLEASLLHRSQWVSIDGAPKTQTFTIDTPLANDKIGIGLSIINDKIGPSDEVFFEGNFSYTLYLSQVTKLAFGLKAGGRMLSVDWSKGLYNDPNDVLLNSNINNKFNPSVGAGVYLHGEKWYTGFSIPNFLKGGNYYDDIAEDVLEDRMHFYLLGGYVFELSENLLFKPAVLLKAVSGAPLTSDFSANFLIQEKVTLGVSYRLEDSLSGLAGFQISPSLFAGYSYDYTLTDLNKYNEGSHELVLRYQLQKKSKQIKSPRFF